MLDDAHMSEEMYLNHRQAKPVLQEVVKLLGLALLEQRINHI